jgi:small subunit ribosomal protein S5
MDKEKNKTFVKRIDNQKKSSVGSGKSVYAEKRAEKNRGRRNSSDNRPDIKDEFEQRIVDIARVTRVMAGGKRMRFRACVVIGNKKGKVAVGIAKGADVTLAVAKAVNMARKDIIDVSIVNTTIPHEINYKLGAAKVLLKPARKGNGVIAGGATRIVLELAGVHNITSKNLGTNNKVNVAKCTIEALRSLKKVEKKKEEEKNIVEEKNIEKKPEEKNKQVD